MSFARNFKLLEELENESNYNGISYGLEFADDIALEHFTGMVIDRNGMMSNFKIYCSQNYPKEPPAVELIHNPNLPAPKNVVALFENGKLKSSCSVLKDWTDSCTIAKVLQYIQKKSA